MVGCNVATPRVVILELVEPGKLPVVAVIDDDAVGVDVDVEGETTIIPP